VREYVAERKTITNEVTPLWHKTSFLPIMKLRSRCFAWRSGVTTAHRSPYKTY
jgi:hypothetical protein